MVKRGRPVGSKNKILTPNSFTIQTNFDKQLEGAPICKNTRLGWVNYGKKNDYPQKLSELYYNSIVHKSCVDFAVAAILGEGIDYEAMQINDSESYPNYQQTWDDFLKSIAIDFILYGSYAFQIIKNRDGKTYSFYHQPISDVRCSPMDEDGVITSYWISKDWGNIQKFKPVEIKRFGFQDDEQIKSGEPYLFVYNAYNPDMEYYTMPKYAGALKAIQTEVELIRYDLRSVKNNFSANGFLVLPRVESDEERQELLTNIKNSFIGSDNANSLVVTFSNGDENDSNVGKFIKIEKDAEDVNLFSENNDRNIDRIISAHRIPSKALIGMPTDGASLGGDGNMLNVSWNLYNKTVVNENRNAIVRTINKMLQLNGIDTKLILKELDFNLTKINNKPLDKIKDDTTVNVDVDENNITEKKIGKDE